jgi:FSR family fosmidomycin resistance protein-like MFS transporter
VSSACLFLFAFESPVVGILAILLFNMTMPITLTALSNILYHNKGMAFGLLTFALFIGVLPVFWGYTGVFNPYGLFAITMFSALVLYEGIKCYEK